MKNIITLLIIQCIICTSKGFGLENLDEILKSAPNKSEISRIKNIDFIYMINLDERPEKFENCRQKLESFNIHPYRFSAVNGWNLSLQTINLLGFRLEGRILEEDYIGIYYVADASCTDIKNINTLIKLEPICNTNRTYFSKEMKLGTIGIVLSHLSVLQDALQSNYETIWVMEDDIDVKQNPNLISKLIEELDELVDDWDILFTDQDTKDCDGNYVPCFSFGRRPNFTPNDPTRFEKRIRIGNFQRIGARYGAYSMVIRRSGIKKILSFIQQHQLFLPYDLEYNLPDDIIMFTVTEDVVSTMPNAPTDNCFPNHKLD